MQEFVRASLLVVSSLALIEGGLLAQSTTRVSVDSAGAEATGGDSRLSSISADGRFVAFESGATNLVAGDGNGTRDVFVRDCLNGTTERVSVATGGAEGNGGSWYPSISADGRFVAFTSGASNLAPGDTNGFADFFVRDRLNGTTERVSVDSGGAQGDGDSYIQLTTGSISADGRFVAFLSAATNLVAGDTNGWPDVFVRDRQTGTTERVSVATGGVQGNDESGAFSISGDGHFVAFYSGSSNLGGPAGGVYLRDLQLGTTECVSLASGGAPSWGTAPSLSFDGRFVAFLSGSTILIPGDTNGVADVFVRDRQLATTERVSVATGGAQGNLGSALASVSADGRFIAFMSDATNLVGGDTNAAADIFVRDRLNGTTERVSVNSANLQGDSSSQYPSISGDGRIVAFESPASNLVAGDTNWLQDIFVQDRTCTGAIYTYCTAKTNSLGCMPSIGSSGLPSQSGPDNFYVTAGNVLNNKNGMMLWSLSEGSNPFFGGTLCVAPTIFRTPAQSSGGNPNGNDCSGTYSYHFTQLYMLQHLLAGNTTVYAQFWSRDPGFAPPYSVGLTNGISFTICP